ncbi:uncharacterized protein LY89DRAFT_675186 [Mollisia scopiformis]|uniref:Uncharacterized protein n=1 Tax=Mollisia scopiformis TaxID=149040 RepID=A0A132BD31_MOLSC|nr:uncharacterized protein LY89DRAFT_675186 [Mollisia scopiformis]KUJ10335.1 hypothetical protein LY89DRAFT_675186 [Mollisia scopiformis]
MLVDNEFGDVLKSDTVAEPRMGAGELIDESRFEELVDETRIELEMLVDTELADMLWLGVWLVVESRMDDDRTTGAEDEVRVKEMLDREEIKLTELVDESRSRELLDEMETEELSEDERDKRVIVVVIWLVNRGTQAGLEEELDELKAEGVIDKTEAELEGRRDVDEGVFGAGIGVLFGPPAAAV